MRLVLLGDPVSHSRSPSIHRAALAACGIAGTYTARRVDAAGVYRAAAEVRAGTLSGANVTMPHKTVAAGAADRLTRAAAAAHSVNTLLARDGEVVGESTDVGALTDVWGRRGLPGDVPVLVLGAGGAAAAAVVALRGRKVLVSARREAAAAALAAAHPGAVPHPWGAPATGAVVVNATPLGMDGEALPEGVMAAASGLVDLAYGPDPTPAVREAGRRNLPAADGIDVLVAQAARSFRLWTGREAPLAVMEAAARRGP